MVYSELNCYSQKGEYQEKKEKQRKLSVAHRILKLVCVHISREEEVNDEDEQVCSQNHLYQSDCFKNSSICEIKAIDVLSTVVLLLMEAVGMTLPLVVIIQQ